MGQSATIYMAPHYSVEEIKNVAALRAIFPKGEANDLNFVMFSTSGIHGSYLTIEEVAASLDTDGPEELTVLVIQPRIVHMKYGQISITAEDVPFLLKLRESSKRVFAEQ